MSGEGGAVWLVCERCWGGMPVPIELQAKVVGGVGRGDWSEWMACPEPNGTEDCGGTMWPYYRLADGEYVRAERS
jgi:hypothetical protein